MSPYSEKADDHLLRAASCSTKICWQQTRGDEMVYYHQNSKQVDRHTAPHRKL